MQTMKYHLTFCSIIGDSIFATPEQVSTEIVDASSERKLQEYIESKKDLYGNPFKKKEQYGFSYISKLGGVKVKVYTAPKTIKL